MDLPTRQLIEALHSSPHQCVLAVTGGGTDAAARLLGVPGGSRTILEILVPYAERALAEFLGQLPEQSCSAETSRAMAACALERARWLAPSAAVVGVGCTASLATDRPKRGEHRFHIAVAGSSRVCTYSLTLNKGARDREGEEAVLDAVLLNALAAAFGVGLRLPVPLLPGEVVAVEDQPAPGALAALFRGDVQAVCVERDGRLHRDAARPKVLVSGSFNPVHDGHWGLAEAASRLAGGEAAFELSVTNVDKPPLPADEVYRRLHQFRWRAPVWLTRAPTFVEKATLFPGVVFAVGADTAARIVATRYYQDSEAGMAEAVERIRAQGCRFLVAGRVAEGRFVGLDQLAVPPAYRDLFTAIPEALFRLDISSTQLRASVTPLTSH